ncbi:patatin-like phospholipase family protein [Sulfitobacter sabulilitoris]|uniref:Patatin-like phospholipase family protein n=1 Tax=Sulfitobacter sabulilitoris TaxID=2562655 RepID=A0A5S3QBU4_9RHOB|nr:patatin-like phospholipase family protein [Sulfitobacter sabulilitoris]TMM54552.1 patatin-like phospholipase family protein [Sulfitobacter sabulilitoris]
MAVKRINLALQGGGAHGAFTWGVLDRLLEDEEIEIAAISGTSAGALNGAALKAGMITGGREGARENLAWLWGKVTGLADMRLASWMAPFGVAAVSRAIEYSVPFAAGETWSRFVSPYAYGPLYRNPLEDVVRRFDYDRVCADTGPELFICATRVRTGKIKIFKGKDITTQSILASACLPTMFQGVEIFDEDTGRVETYWDGGYTGNPALFPLFGGGRPSDILVVNINPLEREQMPLSPQEISNRVNEISFNSSLLRELRAIDFVQRLLREGKIEQGSMAQVFVHMIADDALMNSLSVATKMVPNGGVVQALMRAGHAAADRFLEHHKSDLNQRSTVDLVEMFQ